MQFHQLSIVSASESTSARYIYYQQDFALVLTEQLEAAVHVFDGDFVERGEGSGAVVVTAAATTAHLCYEGDVAKEGKGSLSLIARFLRVI